MEIPTEIMEALIPLILAIIGWALAFIQKIGKDEVTEEKAAIGAFYDPQTGNTEIPIEIPGRAWKMSDETKRWLVAGHNPEISAGLLQQVAEAEAAGKTDYYIQYANGYYHINFGLIQGSASFGK